MAIGILLRFSYISCDFRYIYNQSVFQEVLTDHVVCPDYWWRNTLYVQNWFPFPQLCMMWSWYLANDMQLYVWAIILLVVSTRYVGTSVRILNVTIFDPRFNKTPAVLIYIF